MKKLITILMVAVCFVMLGKTADAQTLYDAFTDGDFTASPVWGGTTTRWQIVANSDVSSGATGSNTVRLNAAAVSTTDYLSSQIATWGTSQEWGFWIGRRAQAFTGANQQYVWLYANESDLTSVTVDGYRIAIGDDSGADDIRLEYIVNGAVSATVIASAGSFTNGLTDIGLLIRVTRSSSGGWEVFSSAIPGSNGAGAIASDIPNSTNAPTSRGTGTNNSLVPSSNGYVGFGALHSTGANAIIGAEFDQIYFTAGFSAPTTQASSITFANVGDNQNDVNWTNGNGTNRVVIMNTANSFTTPTNGTDPTADASWNNAGEQVVYNGSSNTVTVTALSAGTTYWYRVYEYNGTGASTVYYSATATNNPNSQLTTGGGGSTPPTLTAAVGATVDGAFNVTFPDDAVWRAAITSITVGGVTLTAGSSVSAGQITFTPSASNPSNLLQQSGSKNIVVIATGYNDAPVTQSIAPGAATNLGISVQPTAPATNGAVLAQQPVILIRDQYNNTTTSTANVVASVGAGTWSIGGTTTQAGVSGTATFTNLTATSDDAVTGATINFASTGLTGATSGTFNIPAPPTSGLQLSAVGTSYTIDFEGTLTNVSNGAFTGAGFQLSPTAGQLSSSTFAITGSLADGDLAFDGTKTSGDYARGSTTSGLPVSGGIYALTGTPTSTGLGFQPTTDDFTPLTLSMRVQNKTGVTATTLLISYKVHVYNDGDRSSSFNFSHSSDNASYTPVTEMNLSTPQALDGSPAWRTYIRVITINLSLANNGLYYFRLSGDDIAGTGSRDEIVIDDINVIVNPTSSQYPTFSGACQEIIAHGNFGLSGALTVAGSATIANGYTATLGANNLTGTGGSATIANTGTISVDAPSQISGFTTSYGGTYYLTGTNPNIPASTLSGLTVNGGGATLTGDVVVSGTLNLNGVLTVGANTLTISNPIGVTPTNLTMGSTSSLVVDGTAGSIIIPSSVTALNNLTINNTQVVTAAGNVTINGTLTLGASSGFLDMGANTLEIGTSTSNVGALVRNGGSVRGTIKRWLSTTTGSRLFPLDNGSGAYSAADVNFTVAPGTGGSLTATFNNSGSGSLPGGFLATGPEMSNVNLINIAPQWWTISAGDGLTGGTYNLDITGDALPNVVNINFIAIIKRVNNANPWTYTSGNFSVTTGNSSNPVLHYVGGTEFSDFGVGGNVDNPLPVELSSFTSSVSGTNVTLNWSTGFEQNNSGFDIERKSTVGSWSKIGNVAGHGTVNTTSNYTYSDRNLASGKYSYRLKQIDFNGNYKYYDLSNEVIIGTPTKYALSQNFPNPFNPSTSISYEIPAANFVSLKIYDMMGKEVASLVSGNQEAGFYTVKFDASKLSSGIYFYKLQANDFTATKKLMLLK